MDSSVVALLCTCVVSFVFGFILSRFFSSESTSDKKNTARSTIEQKKDGKGGEGKKDEGSEDEDDESDEDDEEEEHKMVFGIRQDLKMAKGKAAAQCCHACLGAYKQAKKKNPDAVRNWSRAGQKKITVTLPDLNALKKVEQDARALGLTFYIVADAGRTQVEAGSLTVIAVGPAPESVINKVTGGFKLY